MEETRHDLIYQLTKLVIQLINLPIESIRFLGSPSLMRVEAEFYLMEFVILDFINKKIKEAGDQWIIKDINNEFNEIFYSILKANPVIEYIKYGNKKIIKSSAQFVLKVLNFQ